MPKKHMSNGLTLVGLVAVAITGIACASEKPPDSEFTTMCRNSDYIRLEDKSCEDGKDHVHGSSVVFISTNSGYHAPKVGNRIHPSQVLTSLPPGKSASSVQKGAVPPQGGVVKNSPLIARGGFGVSGGSKSGGS